jgi:lipid II:glycine glycyltransferase (peptidoglycan interpeptide bridge formation enzyme)
LKLVKRAEMEMLVGSTDHLFSLFTDIYREMVSRKNFAEPNDINQFRTIQSHLPENFKMKIALCKSGGQVCAGAICSTIGETAVYLFGATSDAGMKSRGSYLLQWSFVEQFKQGGLMFYDLNGVNPMANPGTYSFKSDLAGRGGKEVSHLGRFESKGSLLSHLCVHSGETVREFWRESKRLARVKRVANLWPKLAR